MATTVKKGSTGSDVLTLQNMLRQQGYDIAADGIFGSATQSAVQQYQRSQGLAVDGIVGTNTWGALYGTGSGSSSSSASSGGSYFNPATGQMMPAGWTPDQAGGVTAYNPGYSGYPSSGSVSGSGIVNAGYSWEQLMADLNRNPYTPLSEAEILAQARSSYDPIYNANREGLNQAAEQYYLALDQQLSGLGASYDRQRADTGKAFAQAESDAGRSMLQRGMGRSSYGAQITANIATEGAQAQADINAAQTQQETNIGQQRTLYEQQLGQSLTRLAVDYETNITNYANNLRNQERERQIAAQQYGNQLALSLYEAATSQAQWEATFRENQRQFELQFYENQRQFNEQLAASQSKSSGGSGGGTTAAKQQQPTSNVDSLVSYLQGLGVTGTSMDPTKWSIGGTAHSGWVAGGSQTGGNAITEKGEVINAVRKGSSTTTSGGGGQGNLVK